MAKTNGFKEFLLKHGLQILIIALTGFSIVMVYQTKVDANTEGVKENKTEIKRVDAKYPSKEWFNLKFKVIDERMDRFEDKLDGKGTVSRF